MTSRGSGFESEAERGVEIFEIDEDDELLQRSVVVDVGLVGVFETAQRFDEDVSDAVLIQGEGLVVEKMPKPSAFLGM